SLLEAITRSGGGPAAQDPPAPVEALGSEGPEPEVVAESPPPPLPKIAPGTPVAELLPTPPAGNKAPVYVGDYLRRVPELTREAAPAQFLTTAQRRSRKALASAAALHLNAKEQDGYLKALLRTWPDLAGLPFVMGGACRTEGEARAAF